MQYTGLWAKTIYDDGLVFPQELPVCNDTELLSQIASYLRQGKVNHRYRGFSYCRFNCGVPSKEMGNCDVTDGHWIWPYGLTHYAEVHKISLPLEFIRTVQGEAIAEFFFTSQETQEFWQSWSLAIRTAKNHVLISELRAKCDRECNRALERFYAEETRKVGESEKKCMQFQCSASALKGHRLCAQHLYEGSESAGSCNVFELQHRYTSQFLESFAN